MEYATEDRFAVMFSSLGNFKKFFAGSQVIDNGPVTLYIAVCGDEFTKGPGYTFYKRLQSDWNIYLF